MVMGYVKAIAHETVSLDWIDKANHFDVKIIAFELMGNWIIWYSLGKL